MSFAQRITERAHAYVRKPSLAPLPYAGEADARRAAELAAGIIAREGYCGAALSEAMIVPRLAAQRELSRTAYIPED